MVYFYFQSYTHFAASEHGLNNYWSHALSKTCAFLLIGSKANGDLCPPCGPLKGIFDGSNLSKSTSLAIALRKFTAWMEDGSVSGVRPKKPYYHIKRNSRKTTYRLRMPPLTTKLKPTQVSATARRAHHHIGRLLDLLIWYRLIARNRIILGMQAHGRDSNGEHAIRTRRISVVCSFGRVSPSSTLELAVELVQVLDRVHLLGGDGFVQGNLLSVQVEEGTHGFAHGFAVDVHAEPGAL